MAKRYTKAELEALLTNPNVRKMLDLITLSEGVKQGYNTLLGNARFEDFSRHPNIAKSFRQTNGKVNKSTAAGRYQFLTSTWNGLAKQYGLSDFSPKNQDIAALGLIANSGQLEKVVAGDLRGAVSKLGNIWVSFPTSNHPQPKHGWGVIDEYIKSGTWKGKAPSFGAGVASYAGGATPQTQVQPTPRVSQPSYAPSATNLLAQNVQADGTGSTVLQGGAGLVQAQTPFEQEMFKDIFTANLSSERERAVVAASQAVAGAYQRINGGNLMGANQLTNFVADLFDMVEV